MQNYSNMTYGWFIRNTTKKAFHFLGNYFMPHTHKDMKLKPAPNTTYKSKLSFQSGLAVFLLILVFTLSLTKVRVAYMLIPAIFFFFVFFFFFGGSQHKKKQPSISKQIKNHSTSHPDRGRQTNKKEQNKNKITTKNKVTSNLWTKKIQQKQKVDYKFVVKTNQH